MKNCLSFFLFFYTLSVLLISLDFSLELCFSKVVRTFFKDLLLSFLFFSLLLLFLLLGIFSLPLSHFFFLLLQHFLVLNMLLRKKLVLFLEQFLLCLLFLSPYLFVLLDGLLGDGYNLVFS